MSIRFAVYRSTTGEILRTGSCPAKDLGRQARSGQPAIEIPREMGRVNDLTHEVVGHPGNPEIVEKE